MPQRKKFKVGMQTRSAEMVKAPSAGDRTMTISFSSETPVEQYFGMEILDHAPGSVRLERINAKGPLLCNHEIDCQVGVVEKAWIDATTKRGLASIRFSESEEGEKEHKDAINGIRVGVSVRYRVYKAVVEEGEGNSSDTYRIMDWEPYEISIVSVPADITVGIGRAAGDTTNELTIERKRAMPEPTQTQTPTPPPAPAATIDVVAERAAIRKAEGDRAREIRAIADKFGMRELGEAAILGDTSLDAFRSQVMEKMGAKPVATDPNLGMSEREVKNYSLLRAMRLHMDGRPLDGLEKEASDATAKMCGRAAKGFFIPHDIMTAKRALNVTQATAGGYLVGQNVMGGDMIELLRNTPKIAQLGGKTLSGLVGNVAIPRVNGGATAYWLSENGEVTASQQSFGQIGLTPHRLVGDTAYSKELVMQASLDVEGFVRDDLMRVLALEKDRAAINGLGADGEPQGILKTTGIGSVTFGAAPTWAKVVSFETALADANADLGAMAYLTTPAVRGKWKTTPKVANQPIYLWEKGANGSGEVNGYRAEATNQMPTGIVLFGNFADLIIAEWAGLDVVVDPYSLKKSGQIEITTTLWCDFGVRHAASFCKSTDSGAQ